MRIGLPANDTDLNSPISDNFGRSLYYLIYDDKTEQAEFKVNTAAMSQGGAGVKAAQIVVDSSVEKVITPQLGENAFNVLNSADIEIYKSESGTLMDNIKLLKDGQLRLLSSIHRGHHGH
ncbi:MAG: NifB/NifX family molybdenum-iron cluster-binding protein [Gudongella sp.]|jgi:predicted Fe-Mo cluster-binding NifX family protein|nr:NifB/NifX family molybdenum-iron cluster-binding protein [Gudongella sp.]